MSHQLQTALTVLIYAVIAAGGLGMMLAIVAFSRIAMKRERHAEEIRQRQQAVAEQLEERARPTKRFKL